MMLIYIRKDIKKETKIIYKPIYEDIISAGSHLTNVNFSFLVLGNKGAGFLAQYLQQNTHKLKSLHLRSNQISATGAKFIAGALRSMKSIEVLDISNNQIGNEGVTSIVRAARESDSLQVLKIANNKIGNVGIVEVALLIRFKQNLLELDLSDNGLSFPAFSCIIVVIKQNKNLIKLHGVNDDACNAAIKDNLKKAQEIVESVFKECIKNGKLEVPKDLSELNLQQHESRKHAVASCFKGKWVEYLEARSGKASSANKAI